MHVYIVKKEITRIDPQVIEAQGRERFVLALN